MKHDQHASRLFVLSLLASLMDMVRSHLKLNAEQSAAWDIVRGLLSNSPL